MTELQVSIWDGLQPTDPKVRAFQEFHRDNPHVYDRLREMALKLKRVGHHRYGVKGLFEVIRWHHAMATTEPFKLNNNYTAFYARMLMNEEPALREFFELRTARADE